MYFTSGETALVQDWAVYVADRQTHLVLHDQRKQRKRPVVIPFAQKVENQIALHHTGLLNTADG